MAFHIIQTKVEWVPQAKARPEADVLVIPANDHLWMTFGPGVELKKSAGKELELAAVRQGPIAPGALVVTTGTAGFAEIYHLAVAGQDLRWVDGAGESAIVAALERAKADRRETVVCHPLYRGLPVSKPQALKEMFAGIQRVLEHGSTVRRLDVLCADAEEQQLFQQTFLAVLGGSR